MILDDWLEEELEASEREERARAAQRECRLAMIAHAACCVVMIILAVAMCWLAATSDARIQKARAEGAQAAEEDR